MGFRIISPTSPENINTRKRNSISFDDENDRPPLKRNFSGSSPSVLETLSSPSGSQSNSKLRERNKMLASLLAKDTPPTNIPSIPASIISATPQEKLITVNNVYLNHSLGQPTGQNQMRQVTLSTSSSQSNNRVETNNNNTLTLNSDPELSELLEEVIDIMNNSGMTITLIYNL